MYNLNSLKIDSYQGEILEKIYPGFAIRRLLKNIRNIINGLSYSPLWKFNNSEIFNWSDQRFNSENLCSLLYFSKRLLPQTNLLINEIYSKTPKELGVNDLAKIIITARKELYPQIQQFNKTLETKTIHSVTSYAEWQKKNAANIEGKLINKFITDIQLSPPPGIKAILLQGSMSDGNVVKGFSDFDVIYIIELVEDELKMIELLEWIYNSNNYLLSYNPFMHHGPMIVLEEDTLVCSEAVLPSILIEKGVWLHGGLDHISYLDDDYESIIAFEVFTDFFERKFQEPSDFKNVFDVLWWSSSVLFLPLLNIQLNNRKSFWKREVLEKKLEIPKTYWNLIDDVSYIRIKLSEYLINKIDLPLEIDYKHVNPGAVLYNHRIKFQISETDIKNLGITKELITVGKQFFEYCKNKASELNEKNFNDKGYNYNQVKQHWIKDVCEFPTVYPVSIYDEIRNEFLETCKKNPDVIAVYEFGNIGCPGLSDLDFLVVLNDDVFGSPDDLSISKMNYLYAEIMNHDAIFISKSEVNTFGAVSPIFHYNQIYGDPLDIALTESFDDDIQKICYTIQNIVKYPFDLISLSKQKEIRLKTLLAFLNSFNHVKKTLLKSTKEIPHSIDKCIEMNRSLRNDFSDKRISIEQISNAFDLMIEASIDMVHTYQLIWENKISFLRKISQDYDENNFKERVYLSLKHNFLPPPELPLSLKILLNILMKKESDDIFKLKKNQLNHIQNYFEKFVKIRDNFAKNELGRGRPIHGYVVGKELKDFYLQNLSKSLKEIYKPAESELSVPILFLINEKPQQTFNNFFIIKQLKPKKLYVAANGLDINSKNNIENSILARQVILGIDWHCELNTLLNDEKLLQNSFMKNSLNWFFKTEENGIIIEDDHCFSKSSVINMNKVLAKYYDDENIMFISLDDSSSNSSANYNMSEYCFNINNNIWGTWKRAWRFYEDSIKSYPSFLLNSNFNELSGKYNSLAVLKKNFDAVYFQDEDLWYVKWFFACIIKDGNYLEIDSDIINPKINLKNLTNDELIIKAKSDFNNVDYLNHHSQKVNKNISVDDEKINPFIEEQFTSLLQKAESAITENEFDYARELLSIILLYDEFNTYALNDLAVLEIMEDKFDSANRLLNTILKIDKNNSVAKENHKILQGLLTDN